MMKINAKIMHAELISFFVVYRRLMDDDKGVCSEVSAVSSDAVIEYRDFKEQEKSPANEATEEVEEILSHRQAMQQFRDGLLELIVGDPLLCDLPTDLTLNVNSFIALEYGQAMTIIVRRGDSKTYSIVVMLNATVRHLKQAIRHHVKSRLLMENATEHISWKYVWKSYWLSFDGTKLTDDNKRLKDYGLYNRAEVTFVKRLRSKQ